MQLIKFHPVNLRMSLDLRLSLLLLVKFKSLDSISTCIGSGCTFENQIKQSDSMGMQLFSECLLRNSLHCWLDAVKGALSKEQSLQFLPSLLELADRLKPP